MPKRVRSYSYAECESWRNRPAPPTRYMLEEAQEKEMMERKKRQTHRMEHRMKQFKVMGYVRPQQIVDGILYDIESFHRMHRV
jgi:hypothetical protein